jgi:hypothetical protein
VGELVVTRTASLPEIRGAEAIELKESYRARHYGI